VAFGAAYSLTRFQFPARLDLLFLFWVLMIKMIPPIVIAIPLSQVLRLFGLLNTVPGLILVYQVYTLPYCIWLLLGFVRDVPIEIEEAAAIDGALTWQTMRSIVLPLVTPDSSPPPSSARDVLPLEIRMVAWHLVETHPAAEELQNGLDRIARTWMHGLPRHTSGSMVMRPSKACGSCPRRTPDEGRRAPPRVRAPSARLARS
jgi:hypothetical protein